MAPVNSIAVRGTGAGPGSSVGVDGIAEFQGHLQSVLEGLCVCTAPHSCMPGCSAGIIHSSLVQSACAYA